MSIHIVLVRLERRQGRFLLLAAAGCANSAAYATLSVGGTVGLYTISLSTGATNPLGNVGGNLEVIDEAIVPKMFSATAFC